MTTLRRALPLFIVLAILQPLPAYAAAPRQDPPTEPPAESTFVADVSATQPDFSALPDLAPVNAATEVEPPPAPLPLSPIDGELVTGVSAPPLGLPTLIWQPISVPANYHLQLADNAGLSDAIDLYTYSDRYSTGVNNADTKIVWVDGEYFWRVQAIVKVGGKTLPGPYSPIQSFTRNWSATGTLIPALLAPAQGVTLNAFRGNDFSWTPVPGAAWYRFQISPSEDFSTLTYEAATTSTSHTPASRLASNSYHWRVIAVDHRDTYGPPSATGSFTFDWSAPPVMLAPPDDLETPFTPRFSWMAVEAAEYYVLQISTSKTFDASATREYNTANTDYTLTKSLANDQEYFWRVRAIADVRFNPATVVNSGEGTAWSMESAQPLEWRSFKIKWNFAPKLLTPPDLARVSYPLFSWEPVPGVERYQIQIDESSSLGPPLIGDVSIFNTPAWGQPQYSNGLISQYYSWQVRAIDAQGNLTPFSTMRAFAAEYNTAPTYVYPPFSYVPYAADMPVSKEVAIAWPVFIWDTAHVYVPSTPALAINGFGYALPPHHYRLTVDDNDTFTSPNVILETAGLGAALTPTATISALVPGARYFWKVQAFADAASSQEVGFASTWEFRYNPSLPELPFAPNATLIYPADRFDAVGDPPVLGWLPVTGASRYRVQVAADPGFTTVADENIVTGVNYVPWQGRLDRMSNGAWWWRVQPLNEANVPVGATSETRRFHLSFDVPTLNPNEYLPVICTAPNAVPPCAHTVASSVLATTRDYTPIESVAAISLPGSGSLDLRELHIFGDRFYTGNQNWVFAFTAAPAITATVTYSLYLDIDHLENSGGALNPVTGAPIPIASIFRPEYIVSVTRNGNTIAATDVFVHEWNAFEARWNASKRLDTILGQAFFDPALSAVQLVIPYTALGAGRVDFGSYALVLASSMAGVPVGDTIPPQGSTFDRPAFASDMLTPLYPFDTPFSNPRVYQDMQALRWRTPYFDSTDGYQVEVARDAKFTDKVETWETVETKTSFFFQLLPALMQTTKAYGDNESYYWHVRIRHERFGSAPDFFDYGAWSPPMRFKLDSRLPGNPSLTTGVDAFMTPTFQWDRVEGASGYAVQIDNDANFASPLLDVQTDLTSYTPTDLQFGTLAPGAEYFWRVAIRRSSNVIGRWTPTMAFTKSSVAPSLLSPENGAKLVGQPALIWSPILTPPVTPRLATPRYRLQVDDDSNFGSPWINEVTQSTSYTPPARKNLADGSWFWRVALVDATGKDGPFSAARAFTRSYTLPVVTAPQAGARTSYAPMLAWQPIDGAAYYKVDYGTNDTFQGATSVLTDNTSYTPTAAMKAAQYYWRVQMFDDDGRPGPIARAEFIVGWTVSLPIVKR